MQFFLPVGISIWRLGGPAFFPPVPKSVASGVPIRGTWLLTKDDPSTWRRSIYANVKRNLKYPMFEVFDQPNASLSCERREVTTVATQALTLFNNETFLLQAQHLAGARREGSRKRPGGADQAALPDRLQPGSTATKKCSKAWSS